MSRLRKGHIAACGFAIASVVGDRDYRQQSGILGLGHSNDEPRGAVPFLRHSRYSKSQCSYYPITHLRGKLLGARGSEPLQKLSTNCWSSKLSLLGPRNRASSSNMATSDHLWCAFLKQPTTTPVRFFPDTHIIRTG